MYIKYAVYVIYAMSAVEAFEAMEKRRHTKREYTVLYNAVKREAWEKAERERIDNEWEARREPIAEPPLSPAVIAEFMGDYMRSYIAGSYVGSSELYRSYCCWCSENARPPIRHMAFAVAIRKEYPNSSKRRSTGIFYTFPPYAV